MRSGWSEGVEINERMAQKKSRERKKEVVGAAPAVPHWVRGKLNKFCQVLKTLSRVFNPESVVCA
jgi:hypothetical protein